MASIIASLVVLPLALGSGLAGTGASCKAPLQLSCSNTTAVANTCCFNAPGGQLVQTQFWDAGSSSTGPTNSWTLHGLWPDHCDGTYSESCDPARAYTNITAILTAAGKTALLSDMNTYWKNLGGSDEVCLVSRDDKVDRILNVQRNSGDTSGRHTAPALALSIPHATPTTSPPKKPLTSTKPPWTCSRRSTATRLCPPLVLCPPPPRPTPQQPSTLR